MSFASNAKSELCKITKESKCCQKAVLAGMIAFSAVKSRDSIKLTTENLAVGRLIFRLIKDLFGIKPTIKIRKRGQAGQFIIEINEYKRVLAGLGLNGIAMRIHPVIIKKDCCQRAFVRGAFLGGGSISSPQKSYHLEISTKHLMIRRDFEHLLINYGLEAKTIQRKNSYVFYFKGSGQIGDMLALMGAHSTMMEFLNVKITKEMRNNINRIVNCETANVGKTINAALTQKQAIDRINTKIGIDLLPPELQELAWLRLENIQASLKELGDMLEPPITKSAVNRRMKKIIEIANGLS